MVSRARSASAGSPPLGPVQEAGMRQMPDARVSEVVPDVFALQKTWGCNVFIIAGAELSLVDAGFPLDSRALARALCEMDPRGPSRLIATHCHLDHMGSMARIKERFGSTVAAHADDAGVMEGTVPYPTYKLDPARTIYYKLLRPLYPYEYVTVDMRLGDGDVLDVLGGLEVVHVPGHTPGSVALYQRERRLLFTGDTVRNERGVLEGPPPQFTPDIDLAFEGIARRLANLDFDTLLPGHGEVIVSGGRDALVRMLDGPARCG